MDKKLLKPGDIVLFTTNKGLDAIGKITLISDAGILMHDMILCKDFSKHQGKFGGLVTSSTSIQSIIKSS
jgi:hypothetical protein